MNDHQSVTVRILLSLFSLSYWLAWLPGLWLLACHHPVRNNPFDPALTPAVELTSVIVDTTGGTATIEWTPYTGQQTFAMYQVLRREKELVKVDTVVAITNAHQTSYRDASLLPDRHYLYWIAVMNQAGFAMNSNEVEATYGLPSVELRSADFHSATASAVLSWTRYEGPGFRSYQVMRGAPVLIPQIVAEISDNAQTSFTDSELMGNTEYIYKIVVVTDRGNTVSGERRGKFHQLVTTWPVEMDITDYGRLYIEPNDRIILLLAGPDRVRLFFFDPDGHMLEEQELYTSPDRQIVPRSVATALTPEGKRFLSLATGDTLSIMLIGQDGRPVAPEERTLFANAFPKPLGEAEGTIFGEIALWSLPVSTAVEQLPPSSVFPGTSFDNVTVSKGGRLLFEDTFDGGNSKGWEVQELGFTTFGDGRVYTTTGFLQIGKADSSWQNARLEADVVVQNSQAGIRIGDLFRFSSFSLMLDPSAYEAILSWSFQPPPDLGLSFQSETFNEPLLVVNEVAYRLGLEVTDGHVRASVKPQTPVFWKTLREKRAIWNSLTVSEGGHLSLIDDHQPYIISQERETRLPALTTPASDVRVLKGKTGDPFMGICLPRFNRVLFGASSEWPFSGGQFSGTTIGLGVGHEMGQFLYPLSFDTDPDGRIFVLDAGNARIQAFDVKGLYITQWGSGGNGEGQFDFGKGQLPEDFVGSIAVDNQGFIYVLDVGNRRVQKFEP